MVGLDGKLGWQVRRQTRIVTGVCADGSLQGLGLGAGRAGTCIWEDGAEGVLCLSMWVFRVSLLVQPHKSGSANDIQGSAYLKALIDANHYDDPLPGASSVDTRRIKIIHFVISSFLLKPVKILFPHFSFLVL